MFVIIFIVCFDNDASITKQKQICQSRYSVLTALNYLLKELALFSTNKVIFLKTHPNS